MKHMAHNGLKALTSACVLSMMATVERSNLNPFRRLAGNTRWAILLALTSLYTMACAQQLIWLGTGGGTESTATGVSDDGNFVCGYIMGPTNYAFLWDRNTNTMQTLPTLGGRDARAYGISPDGRYVVGRAMNPQLQTRPVRWLNGVPTAITDAEGTAFGVDNTGNTVGYYLMPDGNSMAFLWDGTTLTDLGHLGGGFSQAYALASGSWGLAVVGRSLLSQIGASQDTQEAEAEVDRVLVICPEMQITGSSELIELISSPSNVYLRNARKWRYIPIGETNLRLTTEECDGGSEPRYLCKGCKDVNATHRECAHASMNPQDPCNRQRFPDGREIEAPDICYIIKVKAKTCFEDETGTLMDCKVKVKDPPRDPRTGKQTDGAIQREAYIGGSSFRCIAESQEVQIPHRLWAGCPDCPENLRVNVRLRCVQNPRSQYPCGDRRIRWVRLDVESEFIGGLYECMTRCPEVGDVETPNQDNPPGDMGGGVRP